MTLLYKDVLLQNVSKYTDDSTIQKAFFKDTVNRVNIREKYFIGYPKCAERKCNDSFVIHFRFKDKFTEFLDRIPDTEECNTDLINLINCTDEDTALGIILRYSESYEDYEKRMETEKAKSVEEVDDDEVFISGIGWVSELLYETLEGQGKLMEKAQREVQNEEKTVKTKKTVKIEKKTVKKGSKGKKRCPKGKAGSK